MRKFLDIVSEALDPGGLFEGGWITQDGEFLECDHRAGYHHAQLAIDYYGNPEDDESDDDAADGAIYAAYHDGWIRIFAHGSRAWTAECRQKPSAQAKASLLELLKDEKTIYERYEVAIQNHVKTFVDSRSTLAYIARSF